MMNPEEWIKGSDRDMRHVAVKGGARVIRETSRVCVEVVVNAFKRNVVFAFLFRMIGTSSECGVIGNIINCEQAVDSYRFVRRGIDGEKGINLELNRCFSERMISLAVCQTVDVLRPAFSVTSLYRRDDFLVIDIAIEPTFIGN
jgi:hypothetical protein